ncbi:hypothetical protein AB1Y20_008561 [Prymnesium parvum]|uniref:Helicase/UvrB N-terminal domain-containing protein n=1 Tax=Prymnesium parvum TaxID=97485 RepID=A0AB34IRV2_PRYPA
MSADVLRQILFRYRGVAGGTGHRSFATQSTATGAQEQPAGHGAGGGARGPKQGPAASGPPPVPKFAALYEHLEGVKQTRATTGTRVAVYSNFGAVCQRVFQFLAERFEGQVLFLNDQDSEKTLAAWNRQCDGTKRLAWSTSKRTWEDPACHSDTRGVWILVIGADKREGIDLFATHELHILDPCRTYADDVQLRARIRRTQNVCSTHIGLDVDMQTCSGLGRPFFREKQRGGPVEVLSPRRAAPQGVLPRADVGTKGCCAFGIRYWYYVATTRLGASTRAGVNYALQNVDDPAALNALISGPISFDRILKEKQKATFAAFFELQKRTASSAPSTFAQSYTCSPEARGARGSPPRRDDVWLMDPYPYQEHAHATFVRTMQAGQTEMLLMHGAGTGKSVTSFACVAWWVREHPGARVKIIVPTEALRGQWERQYITPAGMGSSIGVGLYGAPVGDAGLVVFDEAHYLITNEPYRRQYFANELRHAIFLYVTATPVINSVTDVDLLLSRGPRMQSRVVRQHTSATRRAVHAGANYAKNLTGLAAALLLVVVILKVLSLFVFLGSNATGNLGIVESTLAPPPTANPAVQLMNAALDRFTRVMAMGADTNYTFDLKLEDLRRLLDTHITTDIVRSYTERAKDMTQRVVNGPLLAQFMALAREKTNSIMASALQKTFGVDGDLVSTGGGTKLSTLVEAFADRFKTNALSEGIEQVDATRGDTIAILRDNGVTDLASFKINGLNMNVILVLCAHVIANVTMRALLRLTKPLFDVSKYIEGKLRQPDGRITRLHAYYDEGDYCIMPYVTGADVVVNVAFTPKQTKAAMDLFMFHAYKIPLSDDAFDLVQDPGEEELLNKGLAISYLS